MKINLIFIS